MRLRSKRRRGGLARSSYESAFGHSVPGPPGSRRQTGGHSTDCSRLVSTQPPPTRPRLPRPSRPRGRVSAESETLALLTRLHAIAVVRLIPVLAVLVRPVLTQVLPLGLGAAVGLLPGCVLE